MGQGTCLPSGRAGQAGRERRACHSVWRRVGSASALREPLDQIVLTVEPPAKAGFPAPVALGRAVNGPWRCSATRDKAARSVERVMAISD